MDSLRLYELPSPEEAVASPEENSVCGIPASSTRCQYKSKSKKPICSLLCMCALVGFILVGSAAFASLALTVWNSSQVNHLSAKFEIKHMIMQLQNSISGLEISVNDSISEYEGRITQLIFGLEISVNGTISEYERRITQLQNSISGLETSVNGSISELKGSIMQLQNSLDFNRQCGCDGPSTWTRVAFLNMSDPNQVCPSNWMYISSPVRTCGRTQSIGCGCNSVFYSTYGMTYSHVCGRIIAYQHGSPDGYSSCSSLIDGSYMDGVSLTHGSVGSRQHIWSFINARYESSICACTSRNNSIQSTSFVGNDFFCDSGNNGSTSFSSTFYSGDPLWDGQGCGPSSTCCQFNNPPWFCKTLLQSTTDDLEVRICKDGFDEDIPVQLVELYVQ